MSRKTPHRYRLRRHGTSWVVTVPAAISGTVHYVGPQEDRRADAPYTSDAEFSCRVRMGTGDVPEIVYRPENAAARRMLAGHIPQPKD